MMDDLISREVAIKKLKYRYPGVGVDGSKERLRFLQYIADVEAIKEVPSAEPKKGHWIYDVFDYVCSECGEIFSAELRFLTQVHRLPKFCPNCGAYMAEGENDENQD